MVFSLGLSSGGFGGSGGFGSNFGSVANNINQSSPFNSPSPIAFAPSPLPLLPPPLPTPVAPPPPVVAAPPPPPPIAPAPPVTPPPVVETPVAPPPVVPVNPVADPVTVASNPVATDPVPSSPPLDTGTSPTDSFFNPTTDTGNQGLQAQDVQASVGNDPVMSAATFAPTDNTDIFAAQNQTGQDGTVQPDNNPAPDANQGGSGENPILLATTLTANEGTPPVTPDSGNSSDPIQSIQQAGQAVTDAGNQASQNVTETVTQANDSIQQALQPEPSSVTNTEFVTQPSNNDPTFVSEPNPVPQDFNVGDETARAVVETFVPAIGIGEAIAGQTFTGRPLSDTERALLGATSVVAQAAPFAGPAVRAVGEAAQLGPKLVDAAAEVAQAAGNGAAINGAATRDFNAFTGVDPTTTIERTAVGEAAGAAGGAFIPGSTITPAAEQAGTLIENTPAINTALAGAFGAAGNIVGQSINRDGDGQFTPPENLGQLSAEGSFGTIASLGGAAAASAVEQGATQVATQEVGAISGNEGGALAGNLIGTTAGALADGTAAFGSNPVGNAVTNFTDPTPIAPATDPNANVSLGDTPISTQDAPVQADTPGNIIVQSDTPQDVVQRDQVNQDFQNLIDSIPVAP